MKKVGPILGVIGVLGLLVFTTSGFACGMCGMGYGPGRALAQTNLSAEQQQQLDAVDAKYSRQLETLQASLDDKDREYRRARADDSTTVATLNRLEAEMADLDSRYGAVLDQAAAEAAKIMPEGYRTGYNCGYGACQHRHHRGSASYSRHPDPDHRPGMAGHRMASCRRW